LISAHNPGKKNGLLYQRKSILVANYLLATARMEQDNIPKLGFSNPISIIPNGIDLTQSKLKWFMVIKNGFYHVFILKKELTFIGGSCIPKRLDAEIAGKWEEAYIEILTQSALDLKKRSSLSVRNTGSQMEPFTIGDVMIDQYSENFDQQPKLAIGVPVVTTKALLGEIETNHAGGRCH
jgi:hypothetical protein